MTLIKNTLIGLAAFLRRLPIFVCLIVWLPAFAQADAKSLTDVPKIRVKEFTWTSSQKAHIDFILERIKLKIVGQDIDEAQLAQVVEGVTLDLRGDGFLVGQAILSNKNRQVFLQTGELHLIVFPGAVGKIVVKNTSPVDADWIESVATSALCPSGIGDSCILTKTQFERMTQLLQDIVGVQVEALNFSSEDVQVGQTQLIIVTAPRDSRIKGSIGVDNQGFSSTGVYRTGVTASVNNLLAIGDVFSLSAFVSNGGSVSGALDFSGPLGSDGLRWQSALSRSQFFVPNVASSGFGNSISAGLAYPITRGLDSNLTVGLNAVDVMTYSETSGAVTSNKTLQAGQLFLDANSGDRSAYLGKNSWALHSALTAGQVVDVAASSGSNQPLGSYTKWAFQGLGKLALSGDGNLYGSLNFRGQVANTNLDPYEKLMIGGFSGMRAYSPNEGSFNQGTITSLGLHQVVHTAWGRFTPHIFMDYANGWINHSTYANWQVNSGYADSTLSNHMALSDAGLGIDWSGYKDLSVSALWARRLPLSPAGLNTTGNANSQFWFLLQAFFN